MPANQNPPCAGVNGSCCSNPGIPLQLKAKIVAPGCTIDGKEVIMKNDPNTCNWYSIASLVVGSCSLAFRYWIATNVCSQRLQVVITGTECFFATIPSVPSPFTSQTFTGTWGCACDTPCAGTISIEVSEA